MTRVPTPIPESTWQQVTTFLRRGAISIAWKLLVLTVATILILAAAANVGVLGSILLGLFISVVLADDVQALVSDVWHRNFHEIKLNFQR